MLDFYSVCKNQKGQRIQTPVPLESFSLEETRVLACVLQHESNLGRIFHFFEDNQLAHTEVQELLIICKTCLARIESNSSYIDTIYTKALNMLQEACDNEWGLRTVCD